MNATDAEVTTREAARRLGVSQRTVTRYVQSGILDARRVSATGKSGVFLIAVADLDTFDPDTNGPKPRLPDELMREVADLYRAAVVVNVSPRRYIAAKHGKSVNTVDGWITAARKRGFLEPSGS